MMAALSGPIGCGWVTSKGVSGSLLLVGGAKTNHGLPDEETDHETIRLYYLQCAIKRMMSIFLSRWMCDIAPRKL